MADDAIAESFQGLMLRLRGRTKLTQGEVADRVGVHLRSVQAWEGGHSVPNAGSLEALIATYLEANAFAAAQEAAEAEALWTSAERASVRPRPAFDRQWFSSLLATRQDTRAHADTVERGQNQASVPRAQDWGDAPDSRRFLSVGRAPELAVLKNWVIAESSHFVAILGMGGIGKTSLATFLARDLAPQFERVYWRSVHNAPPFGDWCAGAIGFLSDQERVSPETDEARLSVLLELLRRRRCLLVLDNMESLLQSGEREPHYKQTYDGYARLVQVLGRTEHRSCLVVTSREAPPLLAQMGNDGGVHVIELGGLEIADAQALISHRFLSGDEAAWTTLVRVYGGNPLALKMVAETIHQLFGGNIASFLEQSAATPVFGDIRRLIESQIDRLSPTEQQILDVLAIERESIEFGDLVRLIARGMPMSIVLEALEALRRRSLVEHTPPEASFRLPSVVLEYVTDCIVDRASNELQLGTFDLLVSRALVRAQAADYVRKAQERLIAEPLLQRIVAGVGGREEAIQLLTDRLSRLRTSPAEQQGFGPGNLANLLRLLRGDLRGVDLSQLSIREAYLQETDARDASLRGAQLSEVVLADAFSYPTCVALSADASHLAAGTTTGEVCVWRTRDRKLLMTFRGHQGLVQRVAFDGEAHRLASSSEDGTVRIWEVESGTPLATIQPRSGGVRGVALSRQGHLVATGGHDGTVQLWEAQTGRLIASHGGRLSGVRDVAISDDAAVLVSGHADGSVHSWYVNANRGLPPTTQHDAATWSVAVSNDGSVVASGSVDATIHVSRTTNAGAPSLLTVRGHTSAVWSVDLNRDGRLLASGSFDGTIRLWDPSSGLLRATLAGHTGGVRSVALSDERGLLASCSYDGTVRIWHTDPARLVATLRGHTSGVRGVAISGNGDLLATGSYDGAVRLWDAATGRQTRLLQGHTAGVWGVALSFDGAVAATGSFDGTIRLWDARTGQMLKTLEAQKNEVWGVQLSADGRRVASGSHDGSVSLWDASDGQFLARIPGHTGGVWGVALGDEHRVVASGGEDGSVRLWDADNQRLIRTLEGFSGGVWNVALSGNGRRVAGGGEDGFVRVWQTNSGRLLATLPGHVGCVWAVSLSRDGSLVASGTFDGLVHLWETRGGRLIRSLRGHTGPVWSVEFSHNSGRLASGSFDGSLRLWDVSSGNTLHVMRPERRYERLDITQVRGITDAQRDALLALGAIDRGSR